MLNKPALTLFVTIVLAGFTAAYPEYHPHRRNVTPFTTVSLGKRNALTRDDGTFNAEEAVRSAARTKGKHDQNLRNFQHNVHGVASSRENAVTSIAHDSHSKTGSEPLTSQLNGAEYTGLVSVGNPVQSLNVQVDTGSSDLWFPSSDCHSHSCAKKQKYNPAKSKTSKHKPGDFFIRYGDNSTVQGAVYTDTVSVAGIEVTDQYLAAASVLSPVFTNEPDNGLIGLAFPVISLLNHPPFFQTAIQQKKVASGVFALYLAESGSELHLGGTNPRHYSGPIEYHPVIKTVVNGTSEIAFWNLGKAEVGVNGKSVPLSPFQTIIDSGTSIMYGPPDEVKKVYAQVEGSKPLTGDLKGFYSYPCDKVPKISFKWGNGKAWTISEANFSLGKVSKGSSMCIGALAPGKLSLGSTVWLLGDFFMRNVYTVFNMEEKTVGFGQLRQ